MGAAVEYGLALGEANVGGALLRRVQNPRSYGRSRLVRVTLHNPPQRFAVDSRKARCGSQVIGTCNRQSRIAAQTAIKDKSGHRPLELIFGTSVARQCRT